MANGPNISNWFIHGSDPLRRGGYTEGPTGVGSSFPLTASRTSGTAPLAVFFETTLYESSPTESRFHSLDYAHNFGDAGAGNWIDGESKNLDRGAVAGHVYETPSGTAYTSTLNVTDSSGLISTDTTDITVNDPDVVFSGTDTICVSSSGDFTGAPAGADLQTTSSWATVIGFLTSNKRVLLRAGDTWSTSSITSIPGSTNMQFGSFGAGAKPAITYTGGASSTFLSCDGITEFTVYDLDFTSDVGNGSLFDYDSTSEFLLFLRCDASGFAFSMNSATNVAANGTYIDHIFAVECNFTDHSNNAIYSGGERMCFLGNAVDTSTGAHLHRSWYSYKGVYLHNEWSGAATAGTGQHQLKFHGVEDSEVNSNPQAGQKEVRQHCRFNVIGSGLTGGGCPWEIAIGPQNGVQPERVYDTYVDGMKVIQDFGVQSQQQSTIGIIIWADYCGVRNCAIDLTNGQAANISFIDFDVRGVEGPHTGCYAFHNSFFRDVDNNTQAYRGVRISDVNVSDTIVGDNYMVLSNTNGNTITNVDDSGTDTVLITGTNVNDSSSDATAEALLSDPVNVVPEDRNYKPVSGQALGSATFVDVFRDINGDTRPQTNDNIGAYTV